MGKLSCSRESSGSHVGYCNPPQHARFQKGQSGNPHGRPKGTLNIATVLSRTLREKVVVEEGGRSKTVTKLKAAIMQLTSKAAGGDLKALQILASLARAAEEREVQAPGPDSVLDEDDEKVVLGILKRLEGTKRGDNDNETSSE
jgi:hypothetical protein